MRVARAIEAKAKISGILTQKLEIPVEEATPSIEEWAPLRLSANQTKPGRCQHGSQSPI
jgi:hypothetical protein